MYMDIDDGRNDTTNFIMYKFIQKPRAAIQRYKNDISFK